ncbi:MAG: cell division protein FtsK/SpoIIIE [Bacteroidetes bacterium]|nr:cell division protein FtsK/SpoIIIE [Bacteroidota bacterium]
MAKTNFSRKKIQSKDSQSNTTPNKVVRLLKDERTHFILGLIVLVGVVYVTLSLISFFYTGAADQSKIQESWYSNMGGNDKNIENWTGAIGAHIAEAMINRGFGVAAFAWLIFPIVIGLRLMSVRTIELWKAFIYPMLIMIWLSLFLGTTLSYLYKDSFLFLGGEHGYYLGEWMRSKFGWSGTVLVLAVSCLIFCIIIFSGTLPFLRGLFTRKPKPDAAVAAESTAGVMEAIEVEPATDSEAKENTLTIEVDDLDEDEAFVVSTENSPANEEGDFEVVAPQPEAYQPALNNAETHHLFDNTKPLNDEEEYDQSSLGEYDPTIDLSHYKFPVLELLKEYNNGITSVDMDEQNANKHKIINTLKNYGIEIDSIKATVGPTITLYEIVPKAGVRISKIKNLEDDIALSLAALGIRIIAPIPGKGTIGIEVPNRDPQIVSMRSVISSKKFQESRYDLPVAFGSTITNEIFMLDLCKMPHLLVAGATGQGKSVGLNAIITSLLYKKHPSTLKFVLVDPKKVEFNIYSGIEKHFLAKLPDGEEAIITDVSKVVQTLNSLTKEMDDRYELLKKAHVRNIKEYNSKFVSRHLNPEKGHKFLPYIVVIIDEFGDLIMQAGKEVELPIARIAQLARAVGIHMVIATQRPSTNIITGVIKANFPARVAFRVMAMVDSRTILDTPGANQLIGRGDMLFSQGGDLVRVQCAFVDTPEVENIVKYISQQQSYPTAFYLPEYVGGESEGSDLSDVDLSKRDPLFEEAARLIVASQQGSTSLIQRKFSIGYNRAGRLADQLEAAGIIGPPDGSKPRQVLISDEYNLEMKLKNL